MDLTIQSLVQSPYMRAMASVPTRSEELVHGIHDHLPPLVKRRVILNPVRDAGKTGNWRFDIPRMGLWHFAKLVIRPTDFVSDNTKSTTEQKTASGQYTTCIDYVELYSKQRFIEKIFSECITSEMSGFQQSLDYMFTHATITNVGVTHDSSIPFPYRSHIQPQETVSEDNDGKRIQFEVPIPFASFSSVKRNLQTYFIEPLSVIVKTKTFLYGTHTSYNMQLVCEFHDFHPNVETVIRNANYKPSIPATLPWYDWVEFNRLMSSSSILKSYSLESDAIISSLVVVPCKRDYFFPVILNFYIVIQSLSEILFEGTYSELWAQPVVFLNELENPNFADLSSTDLKQKWYGRINVGLRRDNERFSGGWALSSMVNPVITIYVSERAYRTGGDPDLTFNDANANAVLKDLEFKIIGKRHYFLRIDSDTGVMTRSIES